MKVRKFIFKFIDHSTRQVLVFMIGINSNDKSEWTEREGDVQSFLEWKTRCARWYYELKQKVKQIVKETYFPDGQGFADYRLACVKEFKESKKINLSNAPGPVHQMRLIKVKKTYIAKYERGNKPSERDQVLDYAIRVEHQHFKLNGDIASGRVDIQPIDKRITILQESGQSGKRSNTGFTQGAAYGMQSMQMQPNVGQAIPNVPQSNVVLQPVNQLGGNWDESYNNQYNNSYGGATSTSGHGATGHGASGVSGYGSSRGNSRDEEDYKQKYDKYKRKYMELKNKNAGSM